MALSDIDRRLLQRCLASEPRSWEEFVDRFLGLVLHVVDHSADARAHRLRPEDREDLVSEVFLRIVANDFRLLRRFRGESSLATYLTVIARRIVVRQMVETNGYRSPPITVGAVIPPGGSTGGDVEQRISNQEEVARMLATLSGSEAEVVRMYHLEGRSYREISDRVGMPENSIGPTLSRARSKMREASADLS